MKLLNYLKPWRALVILIIFNLFLGLFIGNQYGQTWDEPSFYLYGERSFDAYMRGLTGTPLIPEKHIFFLDLRYYGAFYTAIGWKVVELLKSILKNWGYMDIWHFVNFAFFQIALLSLYYLATRYLKPWTAFLVVLFFSTQPLLFGHAFINPKDIPFLTFFLVSVTFGLYLSDFIKPAELDTKTPNTFSQFNLFLAILFGLLVFTFVGKDLIYSFINWVITSMYNAPAGTFFEKVFSLLVRNATRLPVENYIHKAVSAHLEQIAIYLVLVFVLARKFYLERTFRFKPDLRLWGMVLGAGITLGLATSVRLLAPFAGILVIGYVLATKGWKSLPALICYFSIAAFVCYLTWPFLWSSPAYNFFEGVKVMRDFPFTGEVRFMGDNIQPSALPWYYLPFLITVQSTEPIVILAWLGFGVALYQFKQPRFKEVLVPFIWLILPVGLQIFLHSSAYDNFRQFLFVLPPMFIFAGIGIETLLSWVKPFALRTLMLIFCFVPGVIGLISLHPVQYIYYNSFVGGVAGAEGKFELDYWLTSYRLAGEYVNEHASPDANVLAWGSGYNGARDDLTVYSFSSEADLENVNETFEYAVLTTRYSSQLTFSNAPVVYEVRRGGALLSVVKKLTK